jgi:hypothetical protein
MWAKISNSATSMACAACIAAAATLPWAGSAAERLATEDMRLTAITDIDAFSAIPLYAALLGGDLAAVGGLASINGLPALLALLGGDLTQLLPTDDNPGYDALGALDVFFGDNDGTTGGGVFTGGGIDALGNYDALSALPVFFGSEGLFTTGNLDALADYDALSAIPVFAELANAVAAGDAQGAAAALGGYDALSAVDTFFGDGPIGADEETAIGGVFTGGGIDALAPGSDGAGGYAALSALPVFFGPDTSGNAPFGPGVFTGGGVGALSNYDALSAIPAYLTPAPTTMAAPTMAAPLAASNVAPQVQAQVLQDPGPTSTTPLTGSNTVRTFVASLPEPPSTQSAPQAITPLTGSNTERTFVASRPAPQSTPSAPQAITPPQLPKSELQVEPQATPGDNGGPNLNVSRASQKFTPKSFGDSPILFDSGKGADNGIRGWGNALKSIGLGGGEEGGEGSTR